MKELGSQYFQGGLETPAMELVFHMTKPLCVTVKTYIMEISLCVLKGLVGMLDIGKYGRLLVKKFRNWKTSSPISYHIYLYQSYQTTLLTHINYCP